MILMYHVLSKNNICYLQCNFVLISIIHSLDFVCNMYLHVILILSVCAIPPSVMCPKHELQIRENANKKSPFHGDLPCKLQIILSAMRFVQIHKARVFALPGQPNRSGFSVPVLSHDGFSDIVRVLLVKGFAV